MRLRFLILIIVLVKFNFLLGQTSIFSAGKQFKYLAIYEDSINQIYIHDTIELFITDIPWKHQPYRQKTMIWKYNDNTDSIVKSKLFSIGWIKFDSTGFIENEEMIFIHPPRNNQFSYTEIAPFPQLLYPLENNNEFQRFLFIGTGWGEWDNLKLKNNYEIVKNEKIVILDNEIDCWFINSFSESELGVSYMDFIFNNEIGFIKMNYKFYDNKKIKFELIDYK